MAVYEAERRGGPYRVRGHEDVFFLDRFECRRYHISDHYDYDVTICPTFAVIESNRPDMKEPIVVTKNEVLRAEAIGGRKWRLPDAVVDLLRAFGFRVEKPRPPRRYRLE